MPRIAHFVVYRPSSGEVFTASTRTPQVGDDDLAVLDDPEIHADLIGTDEKQRTPVFMNSALDRDGKPLPSLDSRGNRVHRAIWDGSQVRPATPAERDTFFDAMQSDRRNREKLAIAQRIDTPNGLQQRVLLLTLIDEINLLRTAGGLAERTRDEAIEAYKTKAASADAD